MDGFEEKLQRILGDPEALGTVMELAKSLSSGGGGAPPPHEEPPKPSAEREAEGLSGLSGLSGLLENIDPELLMRLMGAVNEFSRTDDRRMALLGALKPYVRPERAAKLEHVNQIVRIARTASHVLGGFEDKGEK